MLCVTSHADSLPIREEAFMNLKHALAAAFLSTFALAAVAQGTTSPSDVPPKGAAPGKKAADKDDGKKVADKGDGNKKVEDKDGDKDDKADPKKDGKKGHR